MAAAPTQEGLATPGKRTRILVANIPRMLTDIVMAALGSDGEFELLLANEGSRLNVDIEACRPDILIAADVDVSLLYDAPRLKVYLLGADATAVRRVELLPISEDIGPMSLAEFAAEIKSQRKH